MKIILTLALAASLAACAPDPTPTPNFVESWNEVVMVIITTDNLNAAAWEQAGWEISNAPARLSPDATPPEDCSIHPRKDEPGQYVGLCSSLTAYLVSPYKQAGIITAVYMDRSTWEAVKVVTLYGLNGLETKVKQTHRACASQASFNSEGDSQSPLPTRRKTMTVQKRTISDIIEKHNSPEAPGGVFYTTPLFWDCECQEQYIHPVSHNQCWICGTHRDDAPESRLNEVLSHEYLRDYSTVQMLENLAAERGIVEPIPF